MRVLICGGRHFEDAETIHRELVRLHWQQPITVLIHGSVTGLGIAGEAWARRNGVAVVRYPPNWELFGKKAESLRNAFMLEDSRPDLVIAFPGGRHTSDLIQKALAASVAVMSIPMNGVDRPGYGDDHGVASPVDDDVDPLSCDSRSLSSHRKVMPGDFRPFR